MPVYRFREHLKGNKIVATFKINQLIHNKPSALVGGFFGTILVLGIQTKYNFKSLFAMKTIENKQTFTFKKISAVLIIIVATIFVSCEGPVGPPGIPGEDGYNFKGTTFEFTGNFTPANEYQLVFNFLDNGIDPYESEVILAYILWTNEDGLDFWRPLPQVEYFPSGAILEYNFDFTGDIPNDRIVDMSVFLGGDVDLSTVSTDYTMNQTFRVVVVPSDFMSLANVDANDLSSILNSSNIQLNSLGVIEPETLVDTNLGLELK